MSKQKTKDPGPPTADPPVGIRCRRCGCRHHEVISTDKKNGKIKRTRRCRHCGKTQRTTEKADPEVTT